MIYVYPVLLKVHTLETTDHIMIIEWSTQILILFWQKVGDADEELQLVKGAQTLGLGNWQDIADHIGSRDKAEVKDHYIKYYIESQYYPIPDTTKPVNVLQDNFFF